MAATHGGDTTDNPREMHMLRSSKRPARLMIAVAIGAFAVVALTPGIAQAASKYCSVNGYAWWLPDTCKTGSVPAHADMHWVDIDVSPYAGCKFDIKVRDTKNSKVVFAGRFGQYHKTIWGLYSTYRIEATKVGSGCGGEVFIDNEV